MQGRTAPSSSDAGSTGSLMYDFYWGMELYPRIGPHFDLKTWTNCRMGMMGWGVLVLCYAAAQARLAWRRRQNVPLNNYIQASLSSCIGRCICIVNWSSWLLLKRRAQDQIAWSGTCGG